VGDAVAAFSVEDNHSTVAIKPAFEVGDGFLGGILWSCALADELGGVLGDDKLHHGLAPSGGGDGSRFVVGIAAAADERRVADATGSLVECASGGSGRGDVAFGVEGDGSDGIAGNFFGGEDFVGLAAGGLFFRNAKVFDFAGDDELGVVDQRDAVLGGEAFGAFGDEIDVRALFEHLAGDDDGVAHALDASDASGAKRGAAHHHGIELDLTVSVKEAAASGVEGIVVFHDDDGSLDGFNGATTALEHTPSSGKRVADTVDVSIDKVVRNGPGSAMDQKNRLIGQAASSP